MKQATRNENAYQAPITVSILMVRSDALTCSFQDDSWKRAAERVIEEADRQADHIREGHAKARYEKVFMSTGERLEEHSIESLRADLDAGTIPEGPFKTMSSKYYLASQDGRALSDMRYATEDDAYCACAAIYGPGHWNDTVVLCEEDDVEEARFHCERHPANIDD